MLTIQMYNRRERGDFPAPVKGRILQAYRPRLKGEWQEVHVNKRKSITQGCFKLWPPTAAKKMNGS